MASSSLSKAEYFRSVSESFLEKKARGTQEPSRSCCRTEPTWESEASIASKVEALRSRVNELRTQGKEILGTEEGGVQSDQVKDLPGP